MKKIADVMQEESICFHAGISYYELQKLFLLK